MAEKLEFDLLVKQNDLNKTLKEASSQAQTLSSIFAGGQGSINGFNQEISKLGKETGIASDFMSQFRMQTLGVAAGQLVFSTLSNAINFVTTSITDSVAAFAEQEDAINQLNQSLKITGSYSESATQGVEAFATSLEAVSKFSDDSIVKQVAFARSLGLTTKEAENLVKAGANLSATLGGSLEENVDKLGKTLSGSAGRLQQYIPELKSLTVEQLKAGDAARIVNEKFSGAAANELNTYSGQVAQLKNSFNNLQEGIGQSIAKSTIFQSIIRGTKSIIDDFNDSVSVSGAFLQKASGGNAAASKTAEQLANDYVTLDNEVKKFQKSLEEHNAKGTIAKFFDGSSSVLEAQIDKLTKARDEISAKLETSRSSLAKEPADTGLVKTKTKEELDAYAKRNADILALNEQLVLDSSAIADQAEIAKINNEVIRNESELTRTYEQEIKKAEIIAAQKEASLTLNLTAEDRALEVEKIKAEERLAFIDSYGKREQASRNALIATRKSAEDAMDSYDKKMKSEKTRIQQQDLSVTSNYIQAGIALTKEGSGANKALMIANSLVNTYAGATKAFAEVPFPGNFAVAASITALGLANTAKIAGIGFEQGGFVGGMAGASLGADNRVAQVRDGEMILNASQQKNLMDMLNSGGGSGGDVVIQVDGIEIARAVRTQMNKGFRLV